MEPTKKEIVMLANPDRLYPVPFHSAWNVLDSSKVQDYQTCPRKFFFTHVAGMHPDFTPHDLIFGEAFHLLMGEIYRSRFSNIEGAYDLFLQKYRQHFDSDTDQDYSPKNPERTVAAMQKYIDVYAREDTKLEPVRVEMFGQAPISERYDISFRIDLIVRDEKGQLIPYEHKTSKWNITDWASQWQMKFQIMTYAYVVNCLYGDLQKMIPVVVNGVIFQKTKIELNRIKITKTMADLNLYLHLANSIADAIHTDFDILARTSIGAPIMPCFLPNGNSCMAYNKPCAYLDFCSMYQNPIPICRVDQPGFRREFWNPLENHEVEYVGGKR